MFIKWLYDWKESKIIIGPPKNNNGRQKLLIHLRTSRLSKELMGDYRYSYRTSFRINYDLEAPGPPDFCAS